VGAGLLGEDPVVGIAPPDATGDEGLGPIIDLGDDVTPALVTDSTDPTVRLEDQRAGGPCQADGELELLGMAAHPGMLAEAPTG
jgi:hypothetical protein